MKFKTDRDAKLGYWLILPTVVAISTLIFYPVFYNLWLSMQEVNMNPIQPNTFVGLAHFIDILTDLDFWISFRTSLIFTITTVIGTTVLGLAVALLLNRDFPGRSVIRGVILLPYVTPVISAVFGWKYLFNPVFGQANYFLVDILHLFPQHINWIESPAFAIYAVIIFNIWRNFPFAFLMILAELQSISASLYEAAEVDGASAWQKFKHITLPELKFVLGALVILRTIWNFYKFSEVYLLSASVNVLPVYIYEKAFASYDFGQAAAISAILFIFVLGFIMFYVKKVLEW
ncbi:carbohydrate ABC transporter permease [Halanaerobium salsuginis]|jgi:multiple sugar transport system permease protein|uniref:Multiple sugar transport system permease protein n=1 Tax=Halanaerobium salsuginis TaxID=29563 RepID=A0A1I4IH81_9FIRM|nr:sugar ABC transporter permease [Halanaerobium salsuginis]SFL53644.1 multiple sugar transport system permease protein [Halanaerobium salsuginis]